MKAKFKVTVDFLSQTLANLLIGNLSKTSLSPAANMFASVIIYWRFRVSLGSKSKRNRLPW